MTDYTAQGTTEFTTQAEAEVAATALAGGGLIVADKKTEIVEEPPPSPYDTATLLEDAAMILQWNAGKVMEMAQALFEGIELYGAHTGLITYHRTDSHRIAPEAQIAARLVITRLYGKDTLPPAPLFPSGGGGRVNVSTTPHPLWVAIFQRSRLAKAKDSQPAINTEEDAHEAIRPTTPERMPDSLKSHLDEDALALYRLIWERFIASQMRPAKYRLTTVEFETRFA